MKTLDLKVPSGGKITIPPYPIDQIGTEERAKSFTKRSIKTSSKLNALYTAMSMIDLTTLEGADTIGKVKDLCYKAKHPVQAYLEKNILLSKDLKKVPNPAAVCVYPEMVALAKEELKNYPHINVAAVATAFPSGQFPLDLKLQDVKRTIKLGADEIDMVINRGAFLRGDYQKVFDEIVAVKDICGEKVHLKVILETGELVTYDKVRLASWLAMEAGADFIKTSTGKVTPAATMPVTLVMLNAISDFYEKTGKKIGMKPAGGIRKAKEAIHYLCMVNETLGSEWLTPDLFRFGASTLMNDLLRQIFKQVTGRYYYDKAFSLQ